MSCLLLIDNRVNDVETVVNTVLPHIHTLVFDYQTETLESLLSKIEGNYVSVGLFQENYAGENYQLLHNMPIAILANVELVDPEFQSWNLFVDFFRQLREKTGIVAIDVMGCNIGADANWTRVIEYIQTTLGVSVASSVDATGSESLGGNWILETSNTDLVGKYFTEAIREYQYILGPLSIHTILLTANGDVYAAGSNTSGCCGLGSAYSGYSTVSEFMRVPVSGITGVSYSTNTSYLLTASANVMCVGANANGQLGLGNTTAQTDLSFVRTDATTRLANVAAVAAGGSHSVFLLTDGSALACGLNTNGQLGDGTLTQRTFPVAMRTLVESTQPTATRLMHYKFDGNFINEVTGTADATSVSITFNTSLQKFGSGAAAANHGINPTSGVRTQIALPSFTTTTANLTVSFWYRNTGTNNTGDGEYVWWCRDSTSRLFAIITINATTLAFYNGYTQSNVNLTTSFPQNQWKHIAMVSSSASNNITVYYDGAVATTIVSTTMPISTYSPHRVLGDNWIQLYGYMDEFRLYDAALDATNINFLYTMTNPTPANLNTVASISSVSAGTSHTVLLKRDTGVLSCGTNVNGRLGYISLTDSSFALPVRSSYIVPLTGISQAVAGGSHSLAVTSSNNVYSWGANTSGQLGINSNVDASYATFVLTPAAATLGNITQVAAGTSHSLFLTASGTVFACGLNTSGELGNGTTTSSNQLVSVLNPAGTAALSGITRISATANTSFFLNASGVLFACGSNASNQMGFPNSGATTFYTRPVQVSLIDFGRAKTAGYTALQLRALGAEPWHQQYSSNASLPELVNAGYTISQLNSSGITATTLKNAGVVYRQLSSVGVGRAQLNTLYNGRNVSEGVASTTGYLMSNSVLDPPSAFTISGRTANSLTVGSITAPSNTTGLTAYNVNAVPVTGGSTINTNVTAGNPITGLNGGKIYNMRMRSVNATGNSPYGPSVVQNSTSLATLPTLSVGVIGSSTIDVSFSSALVVQDCSYVLRTEPNVNQYLLSAGATSQQLTGLATGTSYNIFLDASNLYTSLTTNISATTTDLSLSTTASNSISGAYSTKRLSNTYTGPTLEIRRGSDSVTSDFYADNNGNLGTAVGATGTSYATWIGASTGYVSKWYDQSGKGKHATQTNTSIQPSYDSSNKSINFTVTGSFFNLPNSTIPFATMQNSATASTSFTLFAKHGTTGGARAGILGCGTPGRMNDMNALRVSDDGNGYITYGWGAATGSDSITGYAANNRVLLQHDMSFSNASGNSGSTRYFINNTLVTPTNPVRNNLDCTDTTHVIGKTPNNEFLNGSLFYVILFRSILSAADRNVIHAKEYNIF